MPPHGIVLVLRKIKNRETIGEDRITMKLPKAAGKQYQRNFNVYLILKSLVQISNRWSKIIVMFLKNDNETFLKN